MTTAAFRHPDFPVCVCFEHPSQGSMQHICSRFALARHWAQGVATSPALTIIWHAQPSDHNPSLICCTLISPYGGGCFVSCYFYQPPGLAASPLLLVYGGAVRTGHAVT
jgi:hypothetical protein